MNPLLIAGGVLVVLAILTAMFVVSRIKVAGPNEAFIITGKKGKTSDDNSGQKVVMGASVFVVPFIQQLGILDLSSHRINVTVNGAISATGIKCHLEGVAVVKVGGTESAIRAAAQRFLDSQGQIDVSTQEVLSGVLRAIVGRMKVEDIIRDRKAFAAEVAEEAEAALTVQGLVLDTFQIQDIAAEGTYLEDLGRPEAARAKKEAAIAESNAQQEAEAARIVAEQQIAESQQTLALKQAEIQAATEAAQAQAAAAGPLAQAAKDQEILTAQELVAEKQAALKERQLDTEIRKPADAERYAAEQAAQAKRTAAIAEAEARAQSVELDGKAEENRRKALASATSAEGVAEADAILAKGNAEAEALRNRAEALSQLNEAGVIEMIVQRLPEIVSAAAAPMSNIDKLTVISTDGASAVVRTATDAVTQGLQVAEDVTGVNVPGLIATAIANNSALAAKKSV